MTRGARWLVVFVWLAFGTGCAHWPGADPLPSWSPGPARAAIVAFVEDVTKEGGPHYVPPAERIATFDNDGTLWAEQPMYSQLLFAIDRVGDLAPSHPEWREQEPFASVLSGDVPGALAGGRPALMEIIAATHSGISTEEFDGVVRRWIAEARHPTTGRPYTGMVYQPMLELLAYLREHGFQTWIVSGGGLDFMRPWTEAVYGVPPQQVVGSTVETVFTWRDDRPALLRKGGFAFVNDGEGKPVGIHRHIGRRPIAAFGNSDGDLQMLQWATVGEGRRLGVIVNHTDAEREWAYDRKSSIGHLEKALDQADSRGWTVIDMRRDWKVVFPPAE